MGAWTLTPTAPRGVSGGRGLTSGSPGPGAAREREVICGRGASAGSGQRRPRPRGRGALAGRRESGAYRRGRSEVASGAGLVCAGWGRRGRAACLLPAVTEEGMGAKRESRMPKSGPLRNQSSFLGSGTQRQTQSVGRFSRGSPGMPMAEDLLPLPSLPLCERFLPPHGAGATARPRRIVDAGIYGALGETRRWRHRAAHDAELLCPPNLHFFHLVSSGTFRLHR